MHLLYYNVSTHSFSDYEHIVHGELQEKITTLTTQIDSLPLDNKQMKLDLQCRSMHDNLILSGIPEAMQDNPEEAVKKCMHSALKLPMTTLNTITFHHMQRTRRSDDKWPRPIVAKFYKQYNYKYKEFLKRKAREL